MYRMKKKSVWILGGIGGIIVACLACLLPIVVLLAVIQIPLRTNPGMEQGMKILMNDPEVIKVFGAPVQQGIIIMGQIKTTMYGSGSGNLWTPISGPKTSGEATIHVLKQEEGPWYVSDMSIRVNKKQLLIWHADQSTAGFKTVRGSSSQPLTPTFPPATTVPTP